jgi:hypothetical protein
MALLAVLKLYIATFWSLHGVLRKDDRHLHVQCALANPRSVWHAFTRIVIVVRLE